MSEKNWKDTVDWKYPYRGYGLYGALKDPQYIKDKNKTFIENGNGWWVNDGKGWSLDYESPMAYHRRKRKERGA